MPDFVTFVTVFQHRLDVSIPTVTTEGNPQMKYVEYYAKEL
jgi:hypothetical protein